MLSAVLLCRCVGVPPKGGPSQSPNSRKQSTNKKVSASLCLSPVVCSIKLLPAVCPLGLGGKQKKKEE